MGLVMTHIPGKGFEVSGTIAYGELSGLKDAKTWYRTNPEGEKIAVQGSKFRSASGVIRLKGITLANGDGVGAFGPESTADAKLQATLMVRNFRRPPTEAELAERKAKQSTESAKQAIASLGPQEALIVALMSGGKTRAEAEEIAATIAD